jgi:hypothetical protein
MNPSDPGYSAAVEYLNYGVWHRFLRHLLGGKCHIKHPALEAGNGDAQYGFPFLLQLLVGFKKVLRRWNRGSGRSFLARITL